MLVELPPPKPASPTSAALIASKSSQTEKSSMPGTGTSLNVTPIVAFLPAKRGHVALEFVGRRISAMFVQALSMKSLSMSSWAEKLHVPFGIGKPSTLPNTNGISDVCVGPRNLIARSVKPVAQGHEGVWLNAYAYTGTPLRAPPWSAR